MSASNWAIPLAPTRMLAPSRKARRHAVFRAQSSLAVSDSLLAPPTTKRWIACCICDCVGIGDATIDYALRVQRRFRRATSEGGARVVEGLEIVKTYRVLDGVAGVEMPTSTTKSTLRLTRPS